MILLSLLTTWNTCTSMILFMDVPVEVSPTMQMPRPSPLMERKLRYSERWTLPTLAGDLLVLTTLLSLQESSPLPRLHPSTWLEVLRRLLSPLLPEMHLCSLWVSTKNNTTAPWMLYPMLPVPPTVLLLLLRLSTTSSESPRVL